MRHGITIHLRGFTALLYGSTVAPNDGSGVSLICSTISSPRRSRSSWRRPPCGR